MPIPINRNLKQGPFQLAAHVNYEVIHADVCLFLPDPAITQFDSCVEEVAVGERGDIWPLMTPVYYDDVQGGWLVWTVGQQIEGFLIGKTGLSTKGYYGDRQGRLKLDAVECVQGLVMQSGQVWYPDLFLPPGELVADYEQALRGGGLRQLNIQVNGIANVH